VPSVHFKDVAYRYTTAADVLASASFDLGPGWTGVVGANGMGKSTLLELVAGELLPDAGAVQVDPADPPPTMCHQEVEGMSAALHALTASPDPLSRRIVGELGLEAAELERWDTLSPGERKRWQIGAALTADPDVLLLDEPTNHLDAEARELLIAALNRFRGVGLVVSHDRTFLNDLTTKTVRVEHGSVELWNGNYEIARESWEQAERAKQAGYEKAKKKQKRLRKRLANQRRAAETKRARHKKSVREAGVKDHDARSLEAKGRHASGEASGATELHNTKAEIGRVDGHLATFEMRRAIGRTFFFDFEPARRSRLLSFRGDLTAGDKLLAEGLSLDLDPEDRIWLRGPNGAGKTSLLARLAADHSLPPERILYLPQELTQEDVRRLMKDLHAMRSHKKKGKILNLVAALGVDPERLLVSDQPSPGEARKLAMAMGMGRSAWCLLLDEPTNHLDLPSIERLEEAVAGYPGAVIVITHDDDFAEATTTTSWHLKAGVLEEGEL